MAEQTANFDARVAKGELVKLGEGRYQSTQGFDRGEVWTVRASTASPWSCPSTAWT